MAGTKNSNDLRMQAIARMNAHKRDRRVQWILDDVAEPQPEQSEAVSPENADDASPSNEQSET